MDWHASVDIYCERLGPEYWAEPWNAVSNAAFIIAALWAAWTMARTGVRSVILTVLTALVFCIGVGSYLFHTHATVWAGLADVAPIWTFVALYILTCIHIIGGVAPGRIAIGMGLVVGCVIAWVAVFGGADAPGDEIARAPSWTNGSEQYLPAVIAMLFFTVLTQAKGHPIRWWFTGATVMFFVSLSFRTLDVHICEAFPKGTHFLWHGLNGAMLALLLQALIRHRLNHGAPGATRSPS